MKVTLIQATPNPVETISKIASICYDSDPKNPLGLVKHLYKNGHHSVFEHIYFTFKIEDISRACSHQLVRHRHCSFTQRSQRYCSEDGFKTITPHSVLLSDSSVLVYDEALVEVDRAYGILQELGIPNEDARMVLPNACETSLYLSCNLRELIHIANERLCTRAQWEIRELVKEMVSLVAPELKFMLVPKCGSGRIICNSPCRVKKEEQSE
jgi:thymidylate synthase (FAD)